MTSKEATVIASGLTKNLTDDMVRAFPDFEIYTDKEKDQVLNAYRQLGEAPLPKAVTPTKKPAAKKVTKKATKPAAKKVAKKAAKPAAKKNTGTDAQLREQILAGKTNAAALAIVLKKNPAAKTTLACASWNRSQLRNNYKKYGFVKNPNVPTDREAAAK